MKKSSIVRDAKHTPGPWRFPPTSGGPFVFGPDNRSVCRVSDKYDGVTTIANGKLLAAAPDLLAALHLIADAHHYSGMTYCQYVARDAIAKATVHD